MIRREFLALVGSITPLGATGANAQPGVTADWSLECNGETCAVTVYGRVAPSCTRRAIRARVQLTAGDVRTVTGVVRADTPAYCVTILVDGVELHEDTIELVDVELER